jgi:hypothetical protein
MEEQHKLLLLHWTPFCSTKQQHAARCKWRYTAVAAVDVFGVQYFLGMCCGAVVAKTHLDCVQQQ